MAVRQFQLLSWPGECELPPSRGDLLDLMERVQSYHQQKQLEDGKTHVLVHCQYVIVMLTCLLLYCH